jgi:hypothetical protein
MLAGRARRDAQRVQEEGREARAAVRLLLVVRGRARLLLLRAMGTTDEENDVAMTHT